MKAKYIILLEDGCGIRHTVFPVYFDTFGAARGALLEELTRNPAPQTVEQVGEGRWKVVETETMQLDWEDEPLSMEFETFYAIEEVSPSGKFAEGQTMYAVIGKENEPPVLSKGFPAKEEAVAALKSHNPKAANVFDDEWAATDPELELTRYYIVAAFDHAPKELL